MSSSCIILNLKYFILDERIGNLTVIVNAKDKIPAVKSQIQLIVRGMYSNPPCHGARIVSTALTVPEYFEEWYVLIHVRLD